MGLMDRVQAPVKFAPVILGRVINDWAGRWQLIQPNLS